ncbi:hypothetical protein MAR_012098 [Mya arenaria]|uniref:Superoxide dismutase copper/zinc binding domain-containing protein n=1 Tax=Mya arenaria TaxID=6604 RepID=A0ABY7FZ10_MYAAR|nr:hypothetical protein MAR_012098 [Mya arenaria]
MHVLWLHAVVIAACFVSTINGRPTDTKYINQFDLFGLWGAAPPPPPKVTRAVIKQEKDEETLHGECHLVPHVRNSRQISDVFGTIQLIQKVKSGEAGPLRVSVRIDGMPTVGMWGKFYKLEVHKYGDVTRGCRAVGPIHSTQATSGHLGDFISNMYGEVNMDINDAASTLYGNGSIFGRSIVMTGMFTQDPLGCCVVVRDRPSHEFARGPEIPTLKQEVISIPRPNVSSTVRDRPNHEFARGPEIPTLKQEPFPIPLKK